MAAHMHLKSGLAEISFFTDWAFPSPDFLGGWGWRGQVNFSGTDFPMGDGFMGQISRSGGTGYPAGGTDDGTLLIV